jgi:hypothetical protein
LVHRIVLASICPNQLVSPVTLLPATNRASERIFFIIYLSTTIMTTHNNPSRKRQRLNSTMPNWFLSCWVLLSAFLSVAEAVCPLCETLQDYPKRMQFLVAPGVRCQDIYVELGRYQPGDAYCRRSKNLYQELCCGDEEPDPIVAPTEPPVYNGPKGPEPDCPVCKNGDFPGYPNQFIIARYVGDYTCEQLYHRGYNGLIPWFMCGPLQDFTYQACGCGEFNPDLNSNPTPPPVPSPTLSNPQPPPPSPPPPAPGPSPTPSPTDDRKTPPSGAKYQRQKLGATRGGAAGAYYRGTRRGRTLLKGEEGSLRGKGSLLQTSQEEKEPMFQTI